MALPSKFVGLFAVAAAVTVLACGGSGGDGDLGSPASEWLSEFEFAVEREDAGYTADLFSNAFLDDCVDKNEASPRLPTSTTTPPTLISN